MVIKKRQILWDWTNSSGAGNPGVPGKLDQVGFGANSPVASLISWNAWVPPELKGRVPFRPMVRELASASGNDWSIIQNNNFPIILFFNEPERHGISPEKARDIWLKQMVPLRKNKGRKLGSPAVASDDNGRKWIEKFMSLIPNDKPDYLCLHYYSTNADEAIKYITNMHNKWNKIPVMVTEIACIDRNYQNVVKFTAKVCNWMDKQSWIAEYGLFDFQRKVADDFVSPAAQLMDANGNFTELGKKYCHEQPMKGPDGKILLVAEAGEEEAAAVGVQSLAVEEQPEEEVAAASAAADDAETDAQLIEPLTNEEGEETATAENGTEEEPTMGIMAISQDAQKALNLHNNKRKGKNLKALTWDDKLAQNATAYAKVLAQKGKLEHSPGSSRPNQGENLAAGTGSLNLEKSAKMWLDEEKNYHGEKIPDGNFGSYGHYTQCMWKSTTKVGMGSAKGSNGWTYVVGRYSPWQLYWTEAVLIIMRLLLMLRIGYLLETGFHTVRSLLR
ncbi:uncharacterized protein PG998_006482 [Apiospora kogelbergensis]|uniref:uncharacterized protein n=1 Tax=Apiospora kogelbergensis TaxID=1337665 RepID=UPI00312E32FB